MSDTEPGTGTAGTALLPLTDVLPQGSWGRACPARPSSSPQRERHGSGEWSLTVKAECCVGAHLWLITVQRLSPWVMEPGGEKPGWGP